MGPVLVVNVVQIGDQVLVLFLSLVIRILYSWKYVLRDKLSLYVYCIIVICIELLDFIYIYGILQSRTKTPSHLKVDVSKSKYKLKTGIVSFFIFI
jgi:hypothetical protein